MSVHSIEISTENLLGVVARMPAREYERFIKKANALRQEGQIPRREAALLVKINTVFPTDKREQYNQLYAKFREAALTDVEHEELLKLSDEFEVLNAERLKYVGQLAKLRKQTLEEVIRDLQLKTSQT
jgi:hypothetical protein